MQLLYSLILTIAFFALLPYFAYQALVNRKYTSNFRERLGLLPDSLKSGLRAGSQQTIWLHAVSVGEILAARPIVKALRSRFPHHRLIISTTTATGQEVARLQVAEADGFCYFPFDWKVCVRRSLTAIRPQIVILMESELWLNFLSECRVRNIPVLVANGRISDRSFVSSQWFSILTRRLYPLVTRFVIQSKIHAGRAVRLGAPLERVMISGNVKYDIGETRSGADGIAKSLDEIFALGSQPLIVAGSTGEGEEQMILSAFERLRRIDGMGNVRLLIGPRHPERFDEVAKQMESSRLGFVRRSTSRERCDLTRTAAMILLDSIGELATLYRFASVVFVGGSLIPKGGHNILEPALYARPIIVGPHMENFREMARQFLRRDALIQLQGMNDQDLVDGLRDNFVKILRNPSRARALGENARRAIEENRGATDRTLAAVVELIEGSANEEDARAFKKMPLR
jgi:3-deoxy-D-manno-octulosonic-acid transferase